MLVYIVYSLRSDRNHQLTSRILRRHGAHPAKQRLDPMLIPCERHVIPPQIARKSPASPTQVQPKSFAFPTRIKRKPLPCALTADRTQTLMRSWHGLDTSAMQSRHGPDASAIQSRYEPHASPTQVRRESNASSAHPSRGSHAHPARLRYTPPVPASVPVPRTVRALSHPLSHTSRIPLYTLAKSCDYAGRHSPAAGKPLQ